MMKDMENALENIAVGDEQLETPETPETPVVPPAAKDPEAQKREDDFRSLREHKKQLERDASTARQEAAEAKRQADYYKAQVEALNGAGRKVEAPKLEDFQGDVEAWADAREAFKALQHQKKEFEQTQVSRTQEVQKAQRKAAVDQVWTERLGIAREVDTDLANAIESISTGKVPGVESIHPEVIDAIKESAVGEELLKHIGLHPTFANELAKLDLQEQAKKLLALERICMSRGGSLSHLRATVSQAPAAVPPKVSGQAPSSRGVHSLKAATSLNDWRAAFKNSLKK
jgi:DNA repair exonuclease SbcCD ATPase subunit